MPASLLRAPVRETRTRPTRARLPRIAAPLVAGVSLASGGATLAAQPVAIAIPNPPTKALPSALDVIEPYVSPVTCTPGDRPGPVAFAKLLNLVYGNHVWGISRTCDGDHGEGRALDWMINGTTADGLALGNAITRWLAAPDEQGRPGAMARRLGISYIIWNRQIWGVYDMGSGWRPYTGPNPHTDHIHFTFSWDGSYQQTSWWTGVALTKVRYTGPTSNPITVVSPAQQLTSTGYPILSRGATGEDVVLAQRLVGADPDGDFGPLTEAAVRAWQGRYAVAQTGTMDEASWAKAVELDLVPRRFGSATAPTPSNPLTAYATTTLRRGSTGLPVIALQQALGGLEPDGEFGPLTEQAVRNYQQSKGLAVNGVVDAPVWEALTGGSSPSPAPPASGSDPYAAYAGTTLQRGATGDAVAALQRGLGGLDPDGDFGPLTQSAVKAAQARWGQPQTGIVDAAFWKALSGNTPGTNTPATPAPTPAPTSPATPAPTPPATGTGGSLAQWYSTGLQVGSTGAAVVALQRGLGGLNADGDFGPLTRAAVVAAQARWGQPQTGVVDEAFWKALDGTTASAQPAGALEQWYGTTLRRGSTGAAVMALQRQLGGLDVDGGFGALTEAAVKAAQAEAGLAQTGVVDEATWRAIDH